MKKIIFILILSSQVIISQTNNKSKLEGKIQDEISEEPLAYASMILYKPGSEEIVSGGISDENGNFQIEVKNGKYDVRIEYISFKPYAIKDLVLTSSKNLGIIKLAPDTNELDGVDLIGRSPDVEIRLDKRVYNIGNTPTSRGGNVADVLEEIPSVSVDIDGNIELRGNTNVRILVDGKPSGLAGAGGIDALTRLPADVIDKIEVITSPSARYQAEGSTGIINIILAKKKNKGLNGAFTVDSGRYDSYSSSASINYRTNSFNLFTNSGLQDKTDLGNALGNNEYLFPRDEYNVFEEKRAFERNRKGYNLNVGIDLFLSKKTTLTASVYYNDREGNDHTETDQKQLSVTAPNIVSVRNENEKDLSINRQISLNLTHNFDEKGHKITLDYQRESNTQDEQTFLQSIQLEPDNLYQPLERNYTDQKEESSLYQIDYVWPINKNQQFEAGYRGEFLDRPIDFLVDFQNDQGGFDVDNNLSNTLDYKQDINAFYTQYGIKKNKLSFLLGLRLEDSNVEIFQEEFSSLKNYTDFFPTLNIGYQINDQESLTLGYNRRISRPRERALNPFQSRTSQTSTWQGNPDLNPSYSNGLDLGYLKQFKKVSIGGSLYFRRTTDARTRITEQTGETAIVNGIELPILTRKPVNLGTNDQYGVEVNSSIRFTPKWRTNLNVNFYRQVEEGFYNNIDYGSENSRWSGRLNNTLTFPYGISSQFSLNYRGPNESAFGKSKAFWTSNLAFSKEILKDNATITLNFRDVFNTSKYRFTTYTEGVKSYIEYQRTSPTYNLSFTYRFKREKQKNYNRNNGYSGEMEF